MNDDWRLRIDLHDDDHVGELTRALEQRPVERGAPSSPDDRAIVTHDGAEVFCYTGTREQAEHAREAVRALAAEHGWHADFELMHWHPTAERWEDPDTPLPATDAQMAQEHRERIAQERSDSAAEGYPEFEVSVHCRSHRDATELAHKLEQEGIPNTHRWTTVLVGANDEDSAGQLADRLRAETPAGCEVTVEGNLRAVYDERPGRRFWFLGGLGG
jgi:hypothetical protein